MKSFLALYINVSVFLCVAPGQPAAAESWSAPNDPAYRRYPADPHQENLFLLDMERAWKIEQGSTKVLIAVVDLAFDIEHPDLKGKLWSNAREVPDNAKDDDGNGYADDIHGWDFVDQDATLDGDQSEHGNHVAGILAADTNNGLGIAGMAPNCPLMLIKIGMPGALRDGGIMARAIRYCADNGARLICMNHGLSEHYPGWHVPVSGELKAACDYAYCKGTLVVSCTSSNDGAYYPMCFHAGYDCVMGTGACDLKGLPSHIYGGSRACEVIAPGGSYDQGNSHSKEAIYSCFHLNGTQYNYYAGGCMATPHVVGLLGLVLSHYEGMDIEQARQLVRNTAKGEKPGFDTRWGHGLIRPVVALSVKKEEIIPHPELLGRTLTPSKNQAGERILTINIRNRGVLDARVAVSLRQGGRIFATAELTVPGRETTEVVWPGEGLPPARELTAHLESLGMARPRVYEAKADVQLRITSDDISVRADERGRKILVAKVRNEGSTEAARVGVILHLNEPGVANRVGPPSQMLEATVISVSGRGAAEAEFDLGTKAVDPNLWVEIEQLDVGARHVLREHGKARLSRGTMVTPARELAHFDFSEGKGNQIVDSESSHLIGTLTNVIRERRGERHCAVFDGRSSQVEIADHKSLSGMLALRVTALMWINEGTSGLQPLVYKWRSGGQSASFGLAVLEGHPYVLLNTDESGYKELVCRDLRITPGRWHTVTLLYTGSTLTALLDDQQSTQAVAASGGVSHCNAVLRFGAAADEKGHPSSFLAGKLAEVHISQPKSRTIEKK